MRPEQIPHPEEFATAARLEGRTALIPSGMRISCPLLRFSTPRLPLAGDEIERLCGQPQAVMALHPARRAAGGRISVQARAGSGHRLEHLAAPPAPGLASTDRRGIGTAVSGLRRNPPGDP